MGGRRPGAGRPPIVRPPKPGQHPLTEADLAEYRTNSRDFFNARRREGWLLQLAARHRLVPIRGSVSARVGLARHLLDDIFTGGVKPGPWVRCMDDLDLALAMLGETKIVKATVNAGAGQAAITLRVAALSRDEALDHLATLGIEPFLTRSAA